jgi:predicted small lipoprotein YifL
MKSLRRAPLLLPALLLAACGQRGDLYFPEQEREAIVTVPAQAPPPATEEEDETPATPPQNAIPNPIPGAQ